MLLNMATFLEELRGLRPKGKRGVRCNRLPSMNNKEAVDEDATMFIPVIKKGETDD